MLAHSPRPEYNIPEQLYRDHVWQVHDLAVELARGVAAFTKHDGSAFVDTVKASAIYHDLGKLDPANQEVLAGKIKARNLPVQHTEAGTAHLLFKNTLASILIRSHHIGLPDFVHEQCRGENCFRDENASTRQHIDKTLEQLLQTHAVELAKANRNETSNYKQPESNTLHKSVLFRLALSCLVDADHTDTSAHYGEPHYALCAPSLRAAERLKNLDYYTRELSRDSDADTSTTKNNLRQQMYESCRDANPVGSIVSCDSPVGSGKTTAVMAHLLRQADAGKLRRIIVVLPFTSIIRQSVEVYRKAIVLEGEDPEEVVSELHHQANFETLQNRHLASVWKAPVIVTTAVNFFETLASNSTSTLRKLNQLPGTAVFIDESHAALPTKLIPLAWHWINIFASEWGCYWLLASGSQSEYWKLPVINKTWSREVPQLVAADLRRKLSSHESERITFRVANDPMNEEELFQFLQKRAGPVLCIVNTVQSAAVIARHYRDKCGADQVEHLSTALTPEDRERTLNRVKERLKNNADKNWVLIATSCVEAGVDFSFKTGVREAASLNSLLQTSGRVNRNALEKAAEVWTISLKREALLKHHPMLEDSRWVLHKLFEHADVAPISAELCTHALEMELKRSGKAIADLQNSEEYLRFPEVEQKFKVINTDTRLVVIDAILADKIANHEPVSWKEIQRKSVQLWGYKIDDLGLAGIQGSNEIYRWGDWGYDQFIGCMKGILDTETFTANGGGIL